MTDIPQCLNITPVHARESDWGFTNFMPLSELLDPSRGYVVNDTCVVEADVLYVRLLITGCVHMPTTENDMPSGSIPLALQSLFYKLQYSDSSVATKELTKSFGWDTSSADVKGCRNVYDSFDKYVEVERLEGDNKYHAEKYGLQL
ncbi:ubiquitin C-terminal hydrolase 12-like [Arachis hypogaea]|uniref:ubiquitin C-terminal hydrolase 12-like n=1 Tax=Arachis hypogaea TaxID=3818 RepID=UPI003B21EE70